MRKRTSEELLNNRNTQSPRNPSFEGFFLLNFKIYFDHMKPILAIFCGLMTFMMQAQTSNNYCDSIIIHSCQPNATGEQIEVIVSNYSTNIMSYPGFVILSENGMPLH